MSVPSRIETSGWVLPAITLVAGLVAGAGSAISFVTLHSNWTQLAWVTPDAKSTVPYWIFEGLIPIVVSTGWTALILRARGHARWLGWSLVLAAVEIALLALALIPVARSGNGGVWATNVGLPALALVLFGGPIAAAVWRLRGSPVNVWWHFAAGLALPVAIYVGFVPTASALGAT
jgi:hypothetical protein